MVAYGVCVPSRWLPGGRGEANFPVQQGLRAVRHGAHPWRACPPAPRVTSSAVTSSTLLRRPHVPHVSCTRAHATGLPSNRTRYGGVALFALVPYMRCTSPHRMLLHTPQAKELGLEDPSGRLW